MERRKQQADARESVEPTGKADNVTSVEDEFGDVEVVNIRGSDRAVEDQRDVEQGEASVDDVDSVVLDQAEQGKISDEQDNSKAIIDLTMEEATGQVASKSANGVQKYGLVNDRPKSIYYTKFCDSCKEWRREGFSCHKCYKRCNVCNQAVSKKNFKRENGDEGMRI